MAHPARRPAWRHTVAKHVAKPRTHRPIVGLTLDSEDPGGYSKFPWYAIRANYAAAVVRAGGIPLALPHETDLIDQYLDRLDALIVTGGNFDVDPALFGADGRHPTVRTKDRRTAFEMGVTRSALARDLPVLGICGGQQLLAVALGGTLIQHIPDDVPGALEHEQKNPRNEPGHEVEIASGTLLHEIVGETRLAVNSAHHQAVRTVPDGVAVDAVAPDGVIEGIEDRRYRFCLGVQWHPEFEITPGDSAIFAALVRAAS